jgi:hypothetical protein
VEDDSSLNREASRNMACGPANAGIHPIVTYFLSLVHTNVTRPTYYRFVSRVFLLRIVGIFSSTDVGRVRLFSFHLNRLLLLSKDNRNEIDPKGIHPH